MSKKNNFSVPVNQLTASYRTKFNMDHTVKGSFNHGLLVPFDVIEVLPGDTFKIDLASIIRMSTPIAPIMDNISISVDAYFVKCRDVYDHWEELQGINKNGAWLTSRGNYTVPTVDVQNSTSIGVTSIGNYMGLPLYSRSGTNIAKMSANALPGRAYALIWNEFYRSPVVSAPLPVDHSDNNDILVSSATVNSVAFVDYTSECLPLAKYADYFTKCLPQPIKHDPIPFITSNLNVGVFDSDSDLHTKTPVFDSGDVDHYFQLVDSEDLNAVIAKVDGAWNTIEALRTAFQLDKFYYKDSYARNYRDMLEAHFAVDNAESELNMPIKIGSLRWRINVDQVLSTSGYAASSSTTVGAPGANSVTTGKGSLTTFSATDHGFIIIVGGCRHDHTYGQGFTKMWTRKDRLDYYDPVFARIGDQPVQNHEIYNAGTSALGPLMSKTFGYQEAWAEYRYLPDRVCGILNPAATGSLDFWTLADSFNGLPQLNEAFVYENRNSLQRALVTGSSGPDYIFDFFFKVTAVREMPLYSIPGLADHF